MKTQMNRWVFLPMILLAIFLLTALPVFGEENRYLYDEAGYLTEAEEAELEAVLKEASESGIRYIVYTSKSYIDEWEYDALVHRLGYSTTDDIVLFAVYPPQRSGARYGYNLAVYGRADKALSDREYNEILDHGDVMDNIYDGALTEGISAVPKLTAYRIEHGRGKSGVGFMVSPLQIFITAIAVAAVFLIFFFSVRANYKKKKKGEQYPLEHYSKTDIKERKDRYSHRHVSVITISNSSGGGRVGGGGGGGARGGGR